MGCARCGKTTGRYPTTMQAASDGTAPRVATTSPVRYIVDGKKFSTLTAAQDYASSRPGAVIRQL
jgi:hypothetical protein